LFAAVFLNKLGNHLSSFKHLNFLGEIAFGGCRFEHNRNLQAVAQSTAPIEPDTTGGS
jgi:hypothetical protein